MALPSLTYADWRFNVNQDLNSPGTLLTCYRQLIRAIKTTLITSSGWTDSSGTSASVTAPWVVVASSNGTTTGTSDLWAADSDLVWAVSGTAHSWVVLRQTGINGNNIEVLLDLNHSNSYVMTQVVSWSGFTLTGLSTLNRPTASDEQQVFSGTWLGPTAAFDCILHVMQTNDGECTRVVVSNAGAVKAAWHFEKPANPETGWSNPAAVYSIIAAGSSYTALHAAAGTWVYFNKSVPVYQTTEVYASGTLGARITVVNDLTSEWPIIPIRLTSTLYPSGVLGELADVWFGATTPADGDAYPASGTLRQFVQFGDQVYPWNQSTPVMT